MEKIFKKSLALMVSAALCLTAFVGCLTVNAETAGSATVTVDEVTAKTTDTTVEVPVTIAVAEGATTGIAAAIFDITVDSAKFDFSKRYWYECLTYDTNQNIHVSTITDGDYIQPVNGTTDTYRFLVEGLAEGSTDESTLGTFTSATFKLTFDVIDNTAGETAITFASTITPQACNAGTLDLQGNYSGDEKPFSVATVDGKITVQAAETHTHAYDDTANQIVTFDATGITYNKVCSSCDELVAESTDTSDDALAVATTASKFAAYSAVNDADGGTFTIDFALPDGKTADDLKVAYVSGDKIIANGYHTSLSDGDLTNGENPIAFSYADGVATLTTDKTGIFIVFIPSADSVLPTANIGMTQTFDLGSSISIQFMVNKTNLANFDSVYAVINHKAYNGNSVSETISYIDTYKTDGNYYVFSYPIAAMQMGDDVTASYYGVEDGVVYLLRQKVDYSLVVYATSGTGGYNGTDSELKTLLSDMFTYGAVAQKVFVYHTDALVTENSAISDFINQYPASTTVAKEDIEYVTSASTYPDPDNKLCGFGKGLNCESTVEVYYRVNLTNFINAYGTGELANLEFHVSYKEPSKTDTDVTPTVVTYGINDNAGVSGNYYIFLANKIVASMMASNTEINIYYNNPSTGIAELIGTSVYSINTYLYANYDSTTKVKADSTATLGEICQAIATYGVSARSYFGIVS